MSTEIHLNAKVVKKILEHPVLTSVPMPIIALDPFLDYLKSFILVDYYFERERGQCTYLTACRPYRRLVDWRDVQ